MTSVFERRVLWGLAALLAALALVVAGSQPAGAAGAGQEVAQAAKKKKCGKKGKGNGKKSAAAAKKKKCGKKKGKGKGGGPTGPQMRHGDYACYSSGIIIGFQVLPGNRYLVNENQKEPGGYVLNAANGHVTFKGGPYGWMYGLYGDGDPPGVSLYSAVNDPPIEVGDYYGSCEWLGPWNG
jgi:hypothetical protein